MQSSRYWKVFLVGFTVITAVYWVLPSGLQSVAYGSYGVIAAIAVVLGARWNDSKHKLGWYGLAAFLVMWSVGDLQWALLASADGSVPLASIADLAYLLGYPFLIAGIIGIYRRAIKPTQPIDHVLDAAIMSIGLFVIGWTGFVLAAGSTMAPAEILSTVAYPALDILVLGLASGFAFTFRRQMTSEMILLGAIALLLLADSAYGLTVVGETFRIGLPLDGMWFGVYALLGAAALHPSMASMGEVRPANRAFLTRSRTTLLALASVTPLVVLAFPQLHEHEGVDAPVVAVAASLVGMLFLWRLGRAHRQLTVLSQVQERLTSELSESEELFRGTFEGAAAAVVIFSMDGVIVRANEACVRLFGYERSELEGMAIAEFDPPESGEDPDMEWSRLLTDGKWGPFERRYRAKNGQDVWGLGTASIVKDADGAPAYVAAQLIDVTAHRQTAEALEMLEREHEVLLDSMGDALIGVDLNRTINYANPAAVAVLGWEEEELIGQNAHALFHYAYPDGTPYPVSECGMVTDENGAAATEVLWSKDGRPIPVEFVARTVFEHGVAKGSVVTFRDITESQALEEQLRQAMKMEAVGQLAGGIAHDFNNLIFAIQASADFIAESVADDAIFLEDIEEIRESTKRAADLVSSLLTFSRRDVVRSELLDVGEVLEQMRKMIRRILPESIAFRMKPHARGSYVRMDPGHLQQIVMNLVVNARDALGYEGELVLGTDVIEIGPGAHTQNGLPAGNYQRLSVSDTGHGMSAETKSRIFDPFYTTKEPGSGTGLGLSTVHGIVEQAGGDIQVDSEIGIGTRFDIYLPLAAEVPERAGEKGTPEGNRGEGQKVLVVEDEEPVRRAIERILRGNGYEVISASSVTEALEDERTPSADVVLTDVIMPGGSGRDLIEGLAEAGIHLKSILMSGYTGNIMIQEGMLDSDSEFLQKPFAKDELLGKLAEVLSA